MAYGTIDVIDFNLDGYLDFVISGADSVSQFAGKIHSLTSKVYINNSGDSFFSEISEIRRTQ